eukprot:TRINITY_DN11434_c0_g1_i2.p1 TRINITY_DN11434_c0_g1~~TRINITY_DN11434_c0_g1_i2.p1  ORF type:complete len:298 (+),score=31.04 TRINITY_DN11434_c0_g1_i2:31-924(+)
MRSIFCPRSSSKPALEQWPSLAKLTTCHQLLHRIRTGDLLPELKSPSAISKSICSPKKNGPALITELPPVVTAKYSGFRHWLSLVKGRRVPYGKLKGHSVRRRLQYSSEENLPTDALKRLLVKRLSERNELYKRERLHTKPIYQCRSATKLNSLHPRKNREQLLNLYEENASNHESSRKSKDLLKWYDARPKLIVNKYYKQNYTPVSTSPKVFRYKEMTVAELWHSISLHRKGAERKDSASEHSLFNNDKIKSRYNKVTKEIASIPKSAIEDMIRKARIKSILRSHRKKLSKSNNEA